MTNKTSHQTQQSSRLECLATSKPEQRAHYRDWDLFCLCSFEVVGKEMASGNLPLVFYSFQPLHKFNMSVPNSHIASSDLNQCVLTLIPGHSLALKCVLTLSQDTLPPMTCNPTRPNSYPRTHNLSANCCDLPLIPRQQPQMAEEDTAVMEGRCVGEMSRGTNLLSSHAAEREAIQHHSHKTFYKHNYSELKWLHSHN